ncbi:hypothetical protein AKO1_002158 [Acrasis kona]|uniref:Uncharacterized protein n=1 Tax=Acrasis kona TaxID=1008807 RepID=A0AAW2Z904_9EUKA
MGKDKKGSSTSKEATISVDPRFLRFEHSKIRPKFSDQKSVKQTLQDILDKKVMVKDLPTITVVPISNSDKHYCSLNNRRCWVYKQLREAGFLETVEVRFKPAQDSRRLKDKYTLEKCSDVATFMKERAVEKSTEQNEDGEEEQEC